MTCMSSAHAQSVLHSRVFFFDRIESASQRWDYAGVLVKFLNGKAASKITELSCLTRQILIKFYKAGICLRAKFGCRNTEFAKKLVAFCVAPLTLNGPTSCGFHSTLKAASGGITNRKAAAARSTGLRPIHFSNRGNGRGFNFRRQALQNCNN